MKILLITSLILSLLAGNVSLADNIECIGMDGYGRTVHVILDWDTLTLNVNGDVLKLVAPTKGENGFATENFISTNGELLYDSITRNNDNSITVNQFNAVTNQFKGVSNLACHK